MHQNTSAFNATGMVANPHYGDQNMKHLKKTKNKKLRNPCRKIRYARCQG
jgi:hypothetical protein